MEKFRLEIQFGAACNPNQQRPAPAEYEVQYMEPLRKSLNATDLLEIWIALEATGILDWARNKAYDSLWDYLKAHTNGGKLPQSGSISISSSQDNRCVKIELENITGSTFDELKIEVKQRVEKNINGEGKIENTIVVKKN